MNRTTTKYIHNGFVTALTALILLLGAFQGKAQTEPMASKNGWYITPKGRFHIMVVYAEMIFDSTFGHLDPTKQPDGNWKWWASQKPKWRDDLISRDPDGDGFMTKYFRQASFGNFQVTGDYLDTLIRVKITEVRNGDRIVTQEAFGNRKYKQAVVDKINSIENPTFGNGSKLEDFDRWTFMGTGKPNKEEPNGQTDLVVIVWRNIHVHNLAPSSGFVSPGSVGEVLGRKSDMYSIFCTWEHQPSGIMRHEFSHMLYGGNNFHTCNGGVGTRMFISTVGGYSNMSGSDRFSHTWNAWDRERMDWKNPENQYVLSTRCADTGTEENGAMEYGQDLCNEGLYLLRDFISSGDAIKIKLPHLPDGVQNQYLWLENHQLKKENYDHDKAVLPGLYAYITVGKDQLEGPGIFGGSNGYVWPLLGQGNYDFIYQREGKSEAIHLNKDRQNPLTGYHYHMRMTTDLDGDGKIRVTQDMSPRTEYFLPNKLFIDGEEMTEDFFSYRRYPQFGTVETAFRGDRNRKIGISHNPSATPVYSHQGSSPRSDDNRRIYLNGLSAEIVRTEANGDMYIRIRWDDFNIVKDVRWCGNILLKEQIRITSGNSVTLDQGYSAQVTKVVQEIDGEGVFAEPTILEVDSGATLQLDDRGKMVVRKGSGLLVRAGAKLSLGRNASLEVEPGAFVYIEQGAGVDLNSRSEIRLASGAEIGVNPILAGQFADLKGGTERFFVR